MLIMLFRTTESFYEDAYWNNGFLLVLNSQAKYKKVCKKTASPVAAQISGALIMLFYAFYVY